MTGRTFGYVVDLYDPADTLTVRPTDDGDIAIVFGRLEDTIYLDAARALDLAKLLCDVVETAAKAAA